MNSAEVSLAEVEVTLVRGRLGLADFMVRGRLGLVATQPRSAGLEKLS
jgi:hypothetical protein